MAALSLPLAMLAGSVVALSARRVLPSPSDAPDDGNLGSGDTGDDLGRGREVVVLIPARDEAETLPTLVADLSLQDHRRLDGSPRYEIVVIDDRSVDQTGPVALAAARSAGIAEVTHLVSRLPGSGLDGKGAALAAVPASRLSGRVVVVLDADARIESDFLRRAASAIASGVPALTARRRPRGRVGRFTTVQSDEQALDAEIQAGRLGFGGCPEMRGNGMVIDAALLQAVGGWAAGSLTEDLELSTRLAVETGIVVFPSLDLWVGESPVTSLGEFRRQRLRWAEGSVRRFMRGLVPVLRSPALGRRAKLDFATYGAQLILPSAILGALLAGLVTRRPGPALSLVGAYVGAGSRVAWSALLREERSRAEASTSAARLGRAIAVGAFSAHWLVILPAALVRLIVRTGPLTFEPTRERLGRTPRSRIAMIGPLPSPSSEPRSLEMVL